MSVAVRIAALDDVAELTNLAFISRWVQALDWPRPLPDTPDAHQHIYDDLTSMVCSADFMVLVLDDHPWPRGFAVARFRRVPLHSGPRAPECEIVYLALNAEADVRIDGQALLDAITLRARRASASALRCIVPDAVPECRELLVQNGWAETAVQYRYGLGPSSGDDEGSPVPLDDRPPVRTGHWAEESPGHTTGRQWRWRRGRDVVRRLLDRLAG